MKLCRLTKVDELGNITMDIVDEKYIVKVAPIYNTIDKYKERTALNLLYGEHLDDMDNIPGYNDILDTCSRLMVRATVSSIL